MLHVTDLHHRFGDHLALDGVSLSVRPGEIVGFLGPNGAGKTTTMRSIMGVSAPDGGRLTWAGRPVGEPERRRFGYMPEERGLYPRMRARDQLVHLAELRGLSRPAAGRRADHWLHALGIAGHARSDVQRLSHGSQQRLQLAAALVHDPDLLILDEPFSGLDPVAVDGLVDVLRAQVAAGRAVLLSSHQLDLVESLCDRVVMLHRGRVVLEGEVAALRRSAGHATLRVVVDGADAGWIDDVAGATLVRADGAAIVAAVAPGTDPAAVLAAARRAGSVTEFAFAPPHLSEVFRTVVAA